MSYEAVAKEAESLSFTEQLNLLSFLASLIAKRNETAQKCASLESAFALSDSLHLSSKDDWTREEIYER